MPNPRITFRVTPELLQQLPMDAEARSQFCLEAIQQKLNPPSPEDELSRVKQRLATLEAAVFARNDGLPVRP